MRRSTERILTTHTGSLPRPDDLIPMPKVTWLKLAAMAGGARLASKQLW